MTNQIDPGLGHTPFFGDEEDGALDVDLDRPLAGKVKDLEPDRRKWTRWFSRSQSMGEPVSFPDDESHGLDEDASMSSGPSGTCLSDELAVIPRLAAPGKVRRPTSNSGSSFSRMVSHVMIKKNIRSFGDAINAPAVEGAAPFSAADGPLNDLWDVKRLKSYPVKKNKIPTFTDSWILREIQIVDEIDPATPFKHHLEEAFADANPQLNTAFYAIWKLSLSPCGEWLLAGTQRGWVYLYKATKGHPKGLYGDRPVGIFKAHEGSVVDIAWLPNAPCGTPMFVTIGFDRRLCLWRCSTPRPIESVRTSEWASSITIHPKDPTQLFLGSLDATVQLWRVQVDETEGKVTTRMSMIDYVRVPDVVTAVSVSPDGQFLAVGMRRGSVAIYDSHSLRFMTEVECQQKKSKRWRTVSHRIVGINWSPDSERFVATAHDSSLRLVNLRLDGGISQQAVKKLTGHTLQYLLLSGCFIPTDEAAEKVLIGSEDDHLYVYSDIAGDNATNVDKIKICKENITACIGTNRNFDQFLNDEVHSALTYKLGNYNSIDESAKSEDEEDDDSTRKSAVRPSLTVSQDRWRTPMYLSAIVGTYTGALKIFVNFGHQ